MAFQEDFDEFLDVDDGFAVWVDVTPSYGPSRRIRGIFDDEYVDSSGGEFVAVEGTQPKFTCRRSDVEDIVYGDFVQVEGKRYSVINIRPDGTGMTEIVLQEEE